MSYNYLASPSVFDPEFDSEILADAGLVRTFGGSSELVERTVATLVGSHRATAASRVDAALTSSARRELAVERLRRLAGERMLPTAPVGYQNWLPVVFPHLALADFADRHIALWEWAEVIRLGHRPPPFVAIWPRGSGKSTTAELVATYLGALRRRMYVWYVSGTQALADLHVEAIAAHLESPTFGHYYPTVAARKIGKFGNVRGWRRNRMRCESGFTVDALGLDTGARGSKVEEQRPDLIILDDLDDITDSESITDKKVATITSSILPAGSKDLAILAIQNMILKDGFFGRLASGKADYLNDRVLSGPHPAIYDLEVSQKAGRFEIVKGRPSWGGQNIEICQSQIDSWGYRAFLREAQHDIQDEGGLFNHIEFRRCLEDEMPSVVRTVCWVDPAVTATDHSDRHGICVASLCTDGIMYIRYSHEERLTPESSLRLAIEKAIEYGASTVGVETDQGGSLWESSYYNVIRAMGLDSSVWPGFVERKAGGASGGSKVERASRLLVGYETGRIMHVYGTHKILEDALYRFPIRKPYDLTDAATWCWIDLSEAPSWAVS